MITEELTLQEFEALPIEVQKILQAFDPDGDAYKECEKLVNDLRPYGYTIDYYLDGVPYNFRKI
jgi:hypothetical protein